MKIVNRKDFLNTPKGTLWSYYEPSVFRDLNVKTSDKHSMDFDFVYFGLIGEFNAPNTETYFDICRQMEQGKSVPISLEETQREGLFDEDQLFLVYENDDIKKMVDMLSSLVKK